MQQRSSKMKRGAQHARLVAGALVRSFSTRGGALAVVFATLLSLGFATLAAAAGAPTKAGASRPPANIRPPQITGQAQVGQILRAEPGKWRAGRWKPSKLSFQWRLCGSAGLSCADVVQAKDGIYAVRPADADHALRVIVRATNAAGTTSASSRQTEPVAPALRDAPVATARPLIVGKAIAGTVLTAEAGAWTGKAPIRTAYRWRRCNEDGGACTATRRTAEQYKLRAGDVGHAIRVLVTAQNSLGTSAALSLPTETVTPSPTAPTAPKNTQRPTIVGTAQQGQTLTARTGSWSGTAPITFSFQWLNCRVGGGRCRAVDGATGQTYTVRASDVRRTLRVRVRASNSAGATSVVSPPTRTVVGLPVVNPTPPRATGQPVISGAALEGKTLTTSNGSWSGTQPMSFRYRWLRCDQSGGGPNGVNCATIPGETRRTYVLANADVGRRIRSRVITTNKYGTASFNSNPTGVVQAAVTASKPSNTAPPTISGAPIAKQTLQASTGSWTGAQPISYTYQWRRCDRNGGSCSSIVGATRNSYALKTADVGITVRVQVTATNKNGSSAATSAPTAVIRTAISSAVIAINDVALPNRLIIDRVSFRPFILRSHRRVTARFRVADSNNRAVQGALVKVIGIPFGRVSTPPEHATGPDGFATFALYPTRRLVLRRGGGIVFFVRARKPGERLIGGVSTRRLVFLRVAPR